jgi:hypothetical protein
LCLGVTVGKDKIYISGYDKVIILNTEGSRIREIAARGYNSNLLYNERNDQLLLRVLLVVLINCMDSSSRRVTTALPVHGTTVIPSGGLVNDISSSYVL